MGKGKIFGSGGGIFVRNADKTKYKSMSGEIPANTFVQKGLVGSPTMGTLKTLGTAGTYPYGAKLYPLSGDRVFCLLPRYYGSVYALSVVVCKIDEAGNVTNGTQLMLSTADYSGGNCCAAVLGNNKVLVCHYDASITTRMKWQLCTVNDLTVTVNATGTVPLRNKTTNGANASSIFAIDGGSRAVFTVAPGNTSDGSGIGIDAFMITISGNTVKFSSGTEIIEPQVGIYAAIGSAKLTDRKFLVSYTDRTASESNGDVRVSLIRINEDGSFTTLSSKIVVTQGQYTTWERNSIVALSEKWAIIAYTYVVSSSNGLRINLIKIDGETITAGSPYAPSTGIINTNGTDKDYLDNNMPVVAIDGSTALVYACMSAWASANVLYSRPIMRTSKGTLSAGAVTKYEENISDSGTRKLGICVLEDGRLFAVRTTGSGGNWQGAVINKVYTGVTKATSQVDGVTVTKCSANKAGTVLEANYT